MLLLTLAAANPSWPAKNAELAPEALSRPEHMPDDPDYAPRLEPGGCAGQHELYSFTPECTPAIEDPAELGAGAHVDRAWLLTIGRPEVSIALIDMGADLADPDLVARIALNAGELPAPRTSTIGPSKHDRNGDGAFTVLDYTTATGTTAPTVDRVIDRALLVRPDRGDVNRNGLLDPADLLEIASDGVDGDGNGYVDDIAGWDFVDDDNDPSEAGREGTVMLRAAAATANNGIGGAGVCPRCSAFALRVGAPARGDHVALAIGYAADAGASAIGIGADLAFGGPLLDAMVAIAIDRGVPILSTAGLGARDPSGALGPGVLVSGGVRHDRSDITGAKSAVSPDGCVRRGPALDVVAPSRCDDRGLAIALGIAGLVRSAELGLPARGIAKLEPPLDGREVALLLEATASDLGEEGWDRSTGFGRIHARAALDALVRRSVPVALQIDEPAAFAVIDPTAADTIMMTGFVDNRRFSAATYEIAAAAGLSPGEDRFETVAGGTAALGAPTPISAAVPLRATPSDPTSAALAEDDHALTIRVRVSTEGGKAAEARRVIYLHRDLEIFPAFPVDLGARPAPLRAGDLDGDGDVEIVAATADGTIHVIGPRGDALRFSVSPRWRRIEAHAGARALAAIDFAREPLVAAPALGPNLIAASSVEGSLIVTDAGGTPLGGFPVTLGSEPAAPALDDLDGDGDLEVLASAGRRVHAFHLDGRALDGFPIDAGEPIGGIALGSVDGDPRLEVVFAGSSRLYVASIDGAIRTVDLGGSSRTAPTPVLADVDGDDQLEVIVSRIGHRPVIVDGDETLLARSERPADGTSDIARGGAPIVAAADHPTIADIDGDEALDILEVAFSETAAGGWAPEGPIERMVSAWSTSTLDYVPGYPRIATAPRVGSAADVDGDDRPEWLIADEGGRVAAVGLLGRSPPAWPKLAGASVESAPAASDIDGDGRTDVVIASSRGLVFAYRTPGRIERIAWEGDGHDIRGTNNVATPIGVRRSVDSEDGCGCTSASNGIPGNAIIAAGILLQRLMCRCTKRRSAGGGGRPS
jgi:hypothetical protein